MTDSLSPIAKREPDRPQAVAWTVGYGGGGGYFTDDERKAASWRDAGATVTPLYRQSQPMLTDEEREAIEWYAGYGKGDHAKTLLGLLKRLG